MNVKVKERNYKTILTYGNDYFIIKGINCEVMKKIRESIKTVGICMVACALVAQCNVTKVFADDFEISKMAEEEVNIQEPPAPEQQEDTPLILSVGPQLTMLCTSSISIINTVDTFMNGGTSEKKFYLALATALVTLISALLWPTLTKVMTKKLAKRKEKKRIQKYTEYLEKKKQEIRLIKNKQKQVLIESTPSLENCKLIVETRPRTLWQRNIEHDDFLDIGDLFYISSPFS